jgi:ADP-heptose:LPS heptosyltransferase
MMPRDLSKRVWRQPVEEPLIEIGTVVHNTCHGIGDVMTGLMVCAGLKAEHPEEPVTYVVQPWLEPWARLFHGFDVIRTDPNRKVKRWLDMPASPPLRNRWEQAAESAGASGVLIPPHRPLAPSSLRWADQFRGCILMAPWSTDPLRTWPLDHWCRLETLLVAAGQRCAIIDDDAAPGTIRDPGRSAGFTSEKLIRMPASMLVPAIKAGALLVGNDSGMAHVAGMLGTPAIALCCPTIGERIFGCYKSVRVIQTERMDGLEPGVVLSAIDKIVPVLGAVPRRVLMATIRGAETTKERERRLVEGWFDRYIRDPGIDIGCGSDPLNDTFRRWDKPEGDCTFLKGIRDDVFATVYSSHCLEHLDDPLEALRNWWRVLRPGGHLVVCVPHRDLYEKRRTLPSRWNGEHKTFWLPDRSEPPCTYSLRNVLQQAIPDGEIVSVCVLDADFVSHGAERHSDGSYSIEAVVLKPT